MTLRQTIQAASAKTNELIAKLANTSNQAVKTREGLVEALTSELSLYVDVEEQHLLSLLRKHPETKALASDAAKANKDLRGQLSGLQAMAKDTDEFLAKVAELKKSFQQHVRDERNELLPAVLKALSDEEAAEAAEKMEAAVAEAEGAKRAAKHAEAVEAKREAAEAQQAADEERAAARAAKRAEAAEAKQEADQAQRVEEEERAAVRAAKSMERAARDATEEAAETSRRLADTVQDGARQVTQRLVETTTTAASSARDAMTIYRSSSENLAEDLRAISTSSSEALKARSEVGSAMTKWVRSATAVNLSASRKLMQCKTFSEVAQAQREFLEASMRTWMEGRSAVLQITERASSQALNPLKARLEKAA
jgi:hypothetical protein